jgi:hypothetical protein
VNQSFTPPTFVAVVAAAVVATGLSACFPSFLMSPPRATIIVTDESGVPLEGATVTLGTIEWHGIGGKNTTQDFTTDHAGNVELDPERVWKMQIMLPDGDVRFSWTMCISKPGFESVPISRIDFKEPVKIAMYPSAVNSVCEWLDDEYRPRVREREARWIEVEGGQWQANHGFLAITDETIRAAMEASAREQSVELRSWSEYRFQYQTRGDGLRDTRLFVRAICRAPADFDLTKAFYSEPDDGACYWDTTYTSQSYADQPKSAFAPLQTIAPR